MSIALYFRLLSVGLLRPSLSSPVRPCVSGGSGGSSPSGASVRLQVQKLREKETISDSRDSQAETSRTTAPDHRDLPLRSDRERTQYSDRDRTYSLRPSEIRTLT